MGGEKRAKKMIIKCQKFKLIMINVFADNQCYGYGHETQMEYISVSSGYIVEFHLKEAAC